jgi:hypothetical protein
MEIREYLDSNNNVINGEVVDLSTEMNKYKDLFETINDNNNINNPEQSSNTEMEDKIRKAMEKVKEKFGQLEPNNNNNSNNGLDKDEEAFILELEKISRQNDLRNNHSNIDDEDNINFESSINTSKYATEFDALDEMERKEEEEELKKFLSQQDRLKMPMASKNGWGKGFLSGNKKTHLKPTANKEKVTTDSTKIDKNDKHKNFSTTTSTLTNNDNNNDDKKNNAFNGTVFERFP